MGFRKKLLEHAITDSRAVCQDAKEVFLHVHVENESAMRFYDRMEFTRGEEVANYSKSLDNGNAVVFSKRF